MTEPKTCRCDKGWVCEAHPDLPYPHADRSGPGQRCDNPNCPYWRGPSPSALRVDYSFVKAHKAGLFGVTTADWDEVDRLRHTLGQVRFNEIQRVTWNRFIAENAPPHSGIWQALFVALRAAVRH